MQSGCGQDWVLAIEMLNNFELAYLDNVSATPRKGQVHHQLGKLMSTMILSDSDTIKGAFSSSWSFVNPFDRSFAVDIVR